MKYKVEIHIAQAKSLGKIIFPRHFLPMINSLLYIAARSELSLE